MKMNEEISFLLRVARNGLILAGLYFVSVYASNEPLTYIMCKPVIIFLVTYLLTELTKRYGIDKSVLKTNNKKAATLFYS